MPKSDIQIEPAGFARLADWALEAERLRRMVDTAVAGGAQAVIFPGVPREARAFLLGLIAREAKRRVWIACDGVRDQDLVFSELANWGLETLLIPEAEMAAIEGAIPDPEVSAERLAALETLLKPGSQVAITTFDSLDGLVPAKQGLRKLHLRLARSMELDPLDLAARLAGAGYERVGQISSRGQFAVRGGIVDIFSFQHQAPVRIEFFGDTLESLREFDLDQQTSHRALDRCDLLLGDPAESTAVALRDYIADADLVISLDQELARANVVFGEAADPDEAAAPMFEPASIAALSAGDFILQEATRRQFFSQLAEWGRDGWRVAICCNNEGEQERLRDLMAAATPAPGKPPHYVGGFQQGSFLVPEARLAVLSDASIFGRYGVTAGRRLALHRARRRAGRAQIDFSELVEDELVVHVEHGIGRYRGLTSLPAADGTATEVLEIEFAGEARLLVPLEHAYLVSRYVGVGRKSPQLSRLGGAAWQRAKRAAERAVFDYASSLLALAAERSTTTGHAFKPDSRWQEEFEQSFLYRETPDQMTAIQNVKADMESPRPMDRLICGDVGFGKTEVAIRAAFKAVMDGRQVAVLVPTTVLAQQHEKTFRERMSDYPVTIEALSRFRSRREQQQTLRGLKDGSVDIVIGTHRLISADVGFKNLGLVVIDEEQRFGVLHKEKFKTFFRQVDVLTLSATPIPRTLYLSLMGARDMSTIETPPPNRLPVETVICPYDERVIRDVIGRELARQGQVFFLHNRVRTIDRIKQRVAQLCPDARIDIGHGQMDEHQLEEVMQRFVRGDTDVLVSTTIIESGIDIPNANTIIIDRADRFGLADLYQLRGRVGRAQHKAYAFFLLPRDMMSTGEARKRISAIRQYSSLGAGFKIAMRDLEIRGAGNLLGTAQSGHILAVGFDLYCQLLKQAVHKLKTGQTAPRADVPVDLDFVQTSEAAPATDPPRAPAYIPHSLVTEAPLRIKAYRDLAQVAGHEQLDQLRNEWRDRFGRLPAAVENLLDLTAIRILAARKKVAKVEVKEGKLMLSRGGEFVMVDGRFPRLTAHDPNSNVREVVELLRSL